jgi:serine/threonine protein kinase
MSKTQPLGPGTGQPGSLPEERPGGTLPAYPSAPVAPTVLSPSGAAPPFPTSRSQSPLPLGADRAIESSPGLSGQLLHHFRVDRPLASGGMGEVYLGFDTSLNRPVAIKTIRAELAQDQNFLARFMYEAQSQANVVHPHVVQVYFIGEERGIWFIAMQVVDGGSLQQLLDRQERLDWKDAARHMIGLVDGLLEAGRLGIVHRDIKPANILLDKFGEAHLADFGLATAQGLARAESLAGAPRTALSGSGLTQAGTVMGTLEYMPPEQLRAEPLDERADIYALGATFYHLLTGRPPVQAATLPEALAALSGPPPPRVRALAPDVPRGLARVIERCLERDRDRRPAGHRSLLALLRRVGPRPEVPASPLLRALSWAFDVLPFALVFKMLFGNPALTGVAGPIAFGGLFLATGLGLATLGATPGQWLMRLRLRTRRDGEVSLSRGLLRCLLQHGFLLMLALFYAAAYGSSPYASSLGVIALIFGMVSLVGALGSLFGTKQTLYDRLTGTRVLVDIG